MGSMESVAMPGVFLSLFTLLPSVQNLFSFATSAAYVLITLLQSILSVVQMPEAGRQIIYRIVIIAMLLLDGRERIEQCNEKGQTHDGSRW
jgi:ribose/xylose/arabinose/galactoside ABC-type transport system permease subunit